MSIAIIDYGAGNLFSVRQAFARLGRQSILTNNEQEIRLASHVVFPGVGHAGAAMKQLQKRGLDKLIPTLEQPVLGICLGMQLMCGWNEEGQLNGLGIFRTDVREMKPETGYPVPHMGWNDVLIDGKVEAYYFVHSYAAEICPESWGTAAYPEPFSAALKKDNFFGVQFHPEKSGIAGEQLLTQFLTQ